MLAGPGATEETQADKWLGRTVCSTPQCHPLTALDTLLIWTFGYFVFSSTQLIWIISILMCLNSGSFSSHLHIKV